MPGKIPTGIVFALVRWRAYCKIAAAVNIFEKNWLYLLEKWQEAETIILLEEFHEILTVSVRQGGGDHQRNHRCQGEWLAIELIERSLCLFTEQMVYHVEEQDLEIDYSRVPAEPKRRFIMNQLEKLPPALLT